MRSSGTTTLFTQPADPGPQPASFAVSVLVHGVAIALVWFAVAYKPPFAIVVTVYYMVRKLDLHSPEMERLMASARIPYPASHSSSRPPARFFPWQFKSKYPAATSANGAGQARAANHYSARSSQAHHPHSGNSSAAGRHLVAAQSSSQGRHASVAAEAHQRRRQALGRYAKSGIEFGQRQYRVHVPPFAQKHRSAQHHLARCYSCSSAGADASGHRLNFHGATPLRSPFSRSLTCAPRDMTVNLPPVNETKASNTQGLGAPGQAQKPTSAQGSADAKTTGAGAGQGPATKTNNPGAGAGQGPVAKATIPGTGAGQGNDTKSSNSGPGVSNGKPGPAQSGTAPSGAAPNSGSGDEVMAGATLVTVPRDGRFGSVIVGDSLQDRYPEVGDMWSGRLTYTAYQHVGLSKSWILQYSIPRSADAASAGTVARLDAPWPYSIVRPNLDPGISTRRRRSDDPRLCVNQTGRFETLTIVFPEDFPKAQFVLAALQKWQFRPASQDGQPARVEVLLIIPDQLE